MLSMTSDAYTTQGDFALVVCPNPSIDIFARIDQLLPANCNRITKEQRFPGGKGVHVALALAELSENVKLLGFWGGPTGSWIYSECEKRYPALKCMGPFIDGWSRCCYTLKTDDQLDETEILGTGPMLDQNDLSLFFDSFNREILKAKCVVLSGSWPMGATGNEYKHLVEIATEHKKASFVDCTGDQLTNALNARPYTVHLNRSEFLSQIGNQPRENSLKFLLNQCQYLALTDGENGLYLMNRNNTIHALSNVSHVHSAVGSGDCLVAGLALGFSKGLGILETARLGASCGAANCIRKDLGMLFQADVDHFYRDTKATELQGSLDLSD